MSAVSRALAVGFLLSVLGVRLVPAAGGGVTAPDRARIEAVFAEYRAGWLANDAERVLRLFSDDAVLMPHHGVEPVVGKAAARAFWFPSSGPPTTVTLLENTIDEIAVSGDVAWVRGHSRVEWTTGTGSEAKRFGNAGTVLTILRRQPGGSWLVAVQMWDDPPNRAR